MTHKEWIEAHRKEWEANKRADKRLIDLELDEEQFDSEFDETRYWKDKFEACWREMNRRGRTIMDQRAYIINEALKNGQLSDEQIEIFDELGIVEEELSYFQPREKFECQFDPSEKSMWSYWDTERV